MDKKLDNNTELMREKHAHNALKRGSEASESDYRSNICCATRK